MDGFFLLLGHLVGDYILQNDWMAQNKANPHPGARPPCPWKYGPPPTSENVPYIVDADPAERKAFAAEVEKENQKTLHRIADWEQAVGEWYSRRVAHRRGALACLCHCGLYTLAVWAFSFTWMPWWGLLACFLAHYALDRWRLAGRWMRNVAGQSGFASGPLAPWSVVVVDNTLHLLTLGVIALLTGRWPA